MYSPFRQCLKEEKEVEVLLDVQDLVNVDVDAVVEEVVEVVEVEEVEVAEVEVEEVERFVEEQPVYFLQYLYR